MSPGLSMWCTTMDMGTRDAHATRMEAFWSWTVVTTDGYHFPSLAMRGSVQLCTHKQSIHADPHTPSHIFSRLPSHTPIPKFPHRKSRYTFPPQLTSHTPTNHPPTYTTPH